MNPARIIAYEDLADGAACEHEYLITPEVYQHFLSAFDDRSPIHVDADYARAHGFADAVSHGAILGGFLSHFIGMVFPGANSLLLSIDFRFSNPSYLGDSLLLHATVAQKLDVQRVVVLHFSFTNQTRGVTAATGRAQVKVRSA